MRPGFLAAILVLAGSSSSAQEKCPPARWVRVVDLSEEAKAFLGDKRYDDALARLREAYGICPEPKLRRAMGRVYEEAGRLEEAREAFLACVEEGAEEPARAECEQRWKAIEVKLATSSVVVEANLPGATVFLDGLDVPHPAGVPIPVRPGRHALEVRANGKMPYRSAFEAVGGLETRIPVVLEALPAKPERVTQSGSSPAWVAAPAFSPQAKWNWVGIGGGVVAAGLGTAFLVQYGLDKSRARGRRETDAGLYEAETVGARDLWLGITLSVAGAGAIVTSSVLWPRVPAKAAVVPVPGGCTGAVSLGW